MRDGDAQDNDLRCRVDDIDSELTIDDLVQILQGGGVVALPTDTFYCLAACAINAEAALRVFEIKRRQATSAVPLLTAEASDVMKYAVDLTEAQQTAVIALGARFWPGPLSLVLKRSPAIPSLLSGGGDTIALRVPNAPTIREVVRRLGAPVTGTSANLSGSPAATTAAAVRETLGAAVDAVVDGGTTPGGPPSTLLDLTTPRPRILRSGAISRADLDETLRDLGAPPSD